MREIQDSQEPQSSDIIISTLQVSQGAKTKYVYTVSDPCNPEKSYSIKTTEPYLYPNNMPAWDARVKLRKAGFDALVASLTPKKPTTKFRTHDETFYSRGEVTIIDLTQSDDEKSDPPACKAMPVTPDVETNGSDVRSTAITNDSTNYPKNRKRARVESETPTKGAKKPRTPKTSDMTTPNKPILRTPKSLESILSGREQRPAAELEKALFEAEANETDTDTKVSSFQAKLAAGSIITPPPTKPVIHWKRWEKSDYLALSSQLQQALKDTSFSATFAASSLGKFSAHDVDSMLEAVVIRSLMLKHKAVRRGEFRAKKLARQHGT